MKNVFLVFLLLGAHAHADTLNTKTFTETLPPGWTLEHREIPSAPLTDLELAKFAKLSREQCQEEHKDRFDVHELITIGKEIWQIIKDGAPVINYASNSASAIPAGANCPFYMSNWHPPQTKTYELRYTNAFNIDTLNLTYKLIYTCEGKYGNKGHYLANVSIHPQDLQVKWGYNFDANVRIADAINVGSMEDPIAGLEIALEWELKNPLMANHAKRSFFVDGLCKVLEL